MPRDAISLDPRLEELAALCGKCTRFADIGCDHGRLGAYLLQTGLCETARFIEISPVSLEKARKLVGLLGFSARAEFAVGDGAEALAETPDVAVIAGMGGETISGIISRGIGRLSGARLVLQPNVDAPMLRRTLAELGYAVVDERIVRDGRRLYVLIAAEPGRARCGEMEIEVGPILIRDRPDTLFEFADFRLRVARKALAGASEGGADARSLRENIAIWEEVSSWRRI